MVDKGFICLFLERWILVQLLHRFQPERGLLPQRGTHQKHGWHHLVWLAGLNLLPEKSWDEDPARRFQTLGGTNTQLYSYGDTAAQRRNSLESQNPPLKLFTSSRKHANARAIYTDYASHISSDEDMGERKGTNITMAQLSSLLLRNSPSNGIHTMLE